MRIGRLAALSGVSTDLLRVWERRFGLFSPVRSPGGYRMYADHDVVVARRVAQLRQEGLPMLEAIAHATGGLPTRSPDRQALVKELMVAAIDLDTARFTAALAAAVRRVGVADAIHDVYLPFLHELGSDWECGRITVAQEHFASHLLRRHVGGFAQDTIDPADPVAVLACPPGELHDIPLLCLGVLLSRSGWTVRYLGANTPIDALAASCRQVEPDLVVLSTTRRTALGGRSELARITDRWPTAIGGRGTGPAVAAAMGAQLLPPSLRDTVDQLQRNR
ncbi:cobalamin-dependent protein [Calidifontibacter terrae]